VDSELEDTDSAQNYSKHFLAECNTVLRCVGIVHLIHTVPSVMPKSRAHKPSRVISIGFISLGVKRLGREADWSVPSIAEVVRVRYFIKHRNNFTFYFDICYYTHTGEPQLITLHQHACLTVLQLLDK
jgi:hypothetical protein